MRKKKPQLNVARKKFYKSNKKYRDALSQVLKENVHLNSPCNQPLLPTFLKKRKFQSINSPRTRRFTPTKSPRRISQTPTKSPRRINQTPTKSPNRKRFRRLQFTGSPFDEIDQTLYDTYRIPPEMLLESASPDGNDQSLSAIDGDKSTDQHESFPPLRSSTEPATPKVLFNINDETVDNQSKCSSCGPGSAFTCTQTESAQIQGKDQPLSAIHGAKSTEQDESFPPLWSFTEPATSKVLLNINDETVDNQSKCSSCGPGSAYTCTQTESAQIQENNEGAESDTEEMIRLMPIVLECLASVGLGNVFLDYFRQLKAGIQTTENIAFLLWTDVVQWYNQPTASTMRYNNDSKKFWRLGWRLFGAKFLNFMSGFKNETQIIEGDANRGNCDPKKSTINFIVPNVRNLREFTPYDAVISGVRKPGIFNDVMRSISPALNHASMCLTFDGKKLKQGLGKDFGDIDILGFEDGPSLSDRLDKLYSRNAIYENLHGIINGYEDDLDINYLNAHDRETVLSELLSAHSVITQEILDIKEIKRKKEYARSKFVERGGKEWRKSKFVYVISAIDAFIHDIDKYIIQANLVMEEIRRVIVHIQKSANLYAHDSLVNLKLLGNYVELKDNALDDTSINAVETEDTRKIKQRTDRWHAIRNRAMITGSTIYKSLGLDSLKKQREHFDKVVCGVPEPEPSSETKTNMEYGTLNEINAAATLVARILPVLEPNGDYHEEGCVVFNENNHPFMVVSPDGSIFDRESGNIIAAVEFKCPVGPLHTSFPERYYLQCISEIEALRTEFLYYISWKPDFTTVFKVEKDRVVFEHALELARETYVTSKKRPTKITNSAKVIKKEIKERIKTIKLIGLFPSVSVSNDMCNFTFSQNEYTQNVGNVNDLCDRLTDISMISYELLRQKATEGVVFLCCDLDRAWLKEGISWSPVCWFPKGYSLDTETTRKVMEQVLNECKDSGLHVPACSFDGQWHNIAVRSVDGAPLTVLQLQKDVWKEVQNLPKAHLEKELKSIPNKPLWRFDNGTITATNGGSRLPKTTSKGWNKSKKQTPDRKDTEVPASASSVLEILPTEVIEASETNIVSSLAMNFDADMEAEISTLNLDNDTWADSFLDAIDEIDDFEDDEEKEELALSNIEAFIQRDNGDGHRKENAIIRNMQTKLNTDDFNRILGLLQTDKTANKNKKWDSADAVTVGEMLSTPKSLHAARDVDLRIVVRYLKRKLNVPLKENVKKEIKIAEITKLIEVKDEDENSTGRENNLNPKSKPRQVKSLSALASASFKTVPKSVLNIIYAEYIWPDRFDKWQKDSATSNAIIEDFEQPDFWFYTPEFSTSRKQLEVRSVDSTHLLTRTRRKSCREGLEGLDNKPWIKVAKQGKTLLTPVMVNDIIDPMSMSMANTHFSPAVQSAMRANGDFEAASLCNDIHDWWRAEDEAGIPSRQRMEMRFKLRRRLLRQINLNKFPPPGQYVHGWPTQLFEALLSNIDSKAHLYALCKPGSYNSRAFSSMMGETFFAELVHHDKTGHGTVSCADFSRYIGTTIEQLHTRLDTSRKFVYRTSSKVRAYVPVSSDMNSEDLPLSDNADLSKSHLGSNGEKILRIQIRDHFFDSEERRRHSGKRRLGTVSTDRNALRNGELGVRYYSARRDDSKILLMKKLGVE